MFVLRTTDSISTISVFFVNSCWYEDCDYCRKNINNRRWLVMYFFLNDCHLYTSFSHIESIWLYIHVFTSCHSIGVKFIRLLLVTPNRRVIAKPKQVLTFTCRLIFQWSVWKVWFSWKPNLNKRIFSSKLPKYTIKYLCFYWSYFTSTISVTLSSAGFLKIEVNEYLYAYHQFNQTILHIREWKLIENYSYTYLSI